MAIATDKRYYSDKPDFSCMSRKDIVISMREAKNPKKQKKILAELCCCTVAGIEKVLKEGTKNEC